MGLFDIFKSKKKKQSEQTIAKLQEETMRMSFPKGKDDMKRQVLELSEMLGGKYTVGEIGGTLCYMNSLFLVAKDKSANRIVKIGALHRPDNKFTEHDAMAIYKYMVRQKVNERFGDKADMMFQTLYESLGNIEGGATTDEIPGGYGEYGLCVTNPIPVNGVMSNEIYLQSLKLLSGEEFTWHRIGSTGAPNIEHPIDMYVIESESRQELCTIYISPYQSITSSKAPKGFYI